VDVVVFLAEFVGLAVLFGAACGVLAAWASRGGSSPMRDVVTAFRSRLGATPSPDRPPLGRTRSSSPGA
jgi:hypothetical protein